MFMAERVAIIVSYRYSRRGRDTYVQKRQAYAKVDSDALTETKTAEERRRLRSKTFKGMADAMAKQWGDYIKQQEKNK